MLLWSSGVLKEGLIIFALGLVLYCVKMILDKTINRIFSLTLLALSLYLLLLTKFYIIAAIIPSIIAWFWCRANNKYILLKFLAVHVVYLTYLFSLDQINDIYNVPQMLALKQQEFVKLAQEQGAKSFIETPLLEPNFKSLLLNSPIALLNSITRPHLLEARSPLIILSAFENITLILFLVIAVFSNGIKKINSSPAFFVALFFSLIMLIVIGLTTPIIGAMVRYRSTVLPFFMIAILWIYNKENFLSKLPALKKIPFFRSA
jgi:hypothetical protein